MAKVKKNVCIVNRLVRMKKVDDPGFQIVEFLKAVGITRACLHEHFKHPELNWKPEHARKIEEYFKIKLTNVKVPKEKKIPVDSQAEVTQDA